MSKNNTTFNHCTFQNHKNLTDEEMFKIASIVESRLSNQVVSLIKELNHRLNKIEEALKK